MAKRKTLSPKQRAALELMVSGKGYTDTKIAELVGVNRRSIYEWKTYESHKLFQDELKRLEDERFSALIDAAKESAMDLLKERNPKITEFILKNAGYNPAISMDVDLTADINITIDEDDD